MTFHANPTAIARRGFVLGVLQKGQMMISDATAGDDQDVVTDDELLKLSKTGGPIPYSTKHRHAEQGLLDAWQIGGAWFTTRRKYNAYLSGKTTQKRSAA